MSLFDSSFLRSCHAFDLAARGSWGERLLGRRIDRRTAGGGEFIGHSDYTSGDDFRSIDWQLCARHDELRTRQFRGCQDRSVFLLIDGSAGMRLGSPAKFDAARRLAGAIGYMALAAGDRVTAAAVSNRVLAESPEIRGRQKAGLLFRFLDGLASDGSPVDLRRAVEAWIADRPRRGLAIVVSDLFDPVGFEAAIDLLARRGFEPFLLQVVSDFDAEPRLSGGVRLNEAGSARRLLADLDEIDLANYRQVFREFSRACRRYCARRSIGIVQTRSSTPCSQAVAEIIRLATVRLRGAVV